MDATIENCIREYYALEAGARIVHFQDTLTMFTGEIDVHITRRALKHIVEQRKRDAYTLETILRLFEDAFSMLRDSAYTRIENVKESGSVYLVEQQPRGSVGVVLVLEVHVLHDESYYIKTGFYRATSKIKKLLKQK